MCSNSAIMVNLGAMQTHTHNFCLRLWSAALLSSALVGDVQAETVASSLRLTVQPTQCVVLEQGQKCHANARVKWQAEQPRSVCLHSSLKQKPVKCWEDAIDGTHQEKVVARSSVYYVLKPLAGGEVLAEAELNVAWVYRESRRPNRQWRLF